MQTIVGRPTKTKVQLLTEERQRYLRHKTTLETEIQSLREKQVTAEENRRRIIALLEALDARIKELG